MPSQPSNVMVIGASGVLAPCLIQYLASKRLEYTVSVLSRLKSNVHVPEGTKVVRSDFTYHSLVQAFREQRFVVDMVACMELKQRKILIDAIVDAGVERLIPGEFSSNMENEAMIALWEMHVDRVEVRKYLKQKAAEKSSFSWTTVTVGPFYDWALKIGFMRYSLENETAEIFDGGLKPFCATTLQKTCDVVDSIFRHLQGTRNKFLYVSSFTTNQMEILDALQKATTKQWAVLPKTTSQIIDDARTKLTQGQAIGQMELLLAAIYAPQFGSDWSSRATDSDKILELVPEDIYQVTQEIVRHRGENVEAGLLARY